MRNTTLMMSALAVLGAGSVASAQDTYQTESGYENPPPPDTYTISPYADGAPDAYAWTAPGLMSGIGVSASAGGGVNGFTERQMRAVTSDVAGGWNVRVLIGSHIPLGFEAQYMGSAQRIDALLGSQNGDLIGSTAEGTLHWNILPHMAFNPYLFGGVGWTNYQVVNTNFRLSDSGMNDSDNLLEVPMGAGFSWRSMTGLVVDLRGTFRWTANQNLVLKSPINFTNTASNSDFVPMHNWAADLTVGYEW